MNFYKLANSRIRSYKENIVLLLVGPNEICYRLHRPFLEKSSHLLALLNSGKSCSYDMFAQPPEHNADTIRVPDLDEDTAHTLVHYLYSGEYRTLTRPGIPNCEKESLEYRRSVLVYQTAVLCGLPSLAAHAKENIKIFGKSVSIFEALDVGREVYEKLPEDETWFPDHLREKLRKGFDADESVFARGRFLEHVKEPFSRTLIQIVVDIFGSKLSSTGVKGDSAERYDYEEPTYPNAAANNEVAENHTEALVGYEDCVEKPAEAPLANENDPEERVDEAPVADEDRSEEPPAAIPAEDSPEKEGSPACEPEYEAAAEEFSAGPGNAGERGTWGKNKQEKMELAEDVCSQTTLLPVAGEEDQSIERALAVAEQAGIKKDKKNKKNKKNKKRNVGSVEDPSLPPLGANNVDDVSCLEREKA
jgi:hypothetical protein